LAGATKGLSGAKEMTWGLHVNRGVYNKRIVYKKIGESQKTNLKEGLHQ